MGITWSPGVTPHEVKVESPYGALNPLSLGHEYVTGFRPKVTYYEEGAGLQTREETTSFKAYEGAMEEATRIGCNLWGADGMLPLPARGDLPMSHKFPPEIRVVYEDAHRVSDSRSSCMLLRAVCEDLCREKGIPGRNFDQMIDNLDKAGGPPRLVKALNAIRLIGNNAAHGNRKNYALEKEHLLELVHIIVEEEWKDRVVNSAHDAVEQSKSDS